MGRSQQQRSCVEGDQPTSNAACTHSDLPRFLNQMISRYTLSASRPCTETEETVRLIRNAVAVVAALLAVQADLAPALAFSKKTESMANASVRQLLRQMDKDKNGTVSKGEFLRYFSERFDQLDVNGDRRLEADELVPMLIPGAKAKKPQPKEF
jgi:EF hand